jgi:two-component system sensor histidine kinase DesK
VDDMNRDRALIPERTVSAGNPEPPPADPEAQAPSRPAGTDPAAAAVPGSTLIARATALPGDPEYSSDPSWVWRRIILIGAIVLFMGASAGGLIAQHAPLPEILFLLPGTALFIVGVFWVGLRADTAIHQQVPWPWLALVGTLGIALFAVGGLSWLTALAIVAAVSARFSATPRPVFAGAALCAAAGLIVGLARHMSLGNTLVSAAVPVLAAFFAYSAARRNQMLVTLQRTRAELARAAAAEERLRIARDLHDLLGHSLSLITLKAELAGRVVHSDADRASRELADLESVARRSLSEVRQAVAGYRQPDFAGELAAARQLFTAAGIEATITVPDTLKLSPATGALLAWAVREGCTNIVRHAAAANVAITAAEGRAGTTLEISDDGTGPAQAGTAFAPAGGVVSIPARTPGAPGPGRDAAPGSGLAGLAERISALGGELSAGPLPPCGFLLRITIPPP